VELPKNLGNCSLRYSVDTTRPIAGLIATVSVQFV